MNKVKFNIPMCMALILLFLTMLSIHVTSNLYARYTVSSEGSDSARVAKFDVTAEVQPMGGEQGLFTVSVKNKSEVAVRYNIVVSFTAPMSVAMDWGTSQKPAENTNFVTFSDAKWVLAPGTESKQHTLKFSMVDWSYVTEKAKNVESYEKAIYFSVRVTAEQIN